MRVYYHGPDAVITESHFLRRSTPPRWFTIADLRDVRLVRCEHGGSRLSLVLASVAVAALIVTPGWVLLTSTGRMISHGRKALRDMSRFGEIPGARFVVLIGQ